MPSPISSSTKLIVLTGGPGAGKTTVLEMAKHMFSDKAIVLPEAATMIYNGGFLRLGTQSCQKAAQRAIYHIQREQERVLEEGSMVSVGVCDRGTLDGLGYWPEHSETFFNDLRTSEGQELARYAAVIHMRTPRDEYGYNLNNSTRIEDPEQAAVLDQKMIDVWKNHPNHFVVNSTSDFLHKAEEVIAIISRFF